MFLHFINLKMLNMNIIDNLHSFIDQQKSLAIESFLKFGVKEKNFTSFKV